MVCRAAAGDPAFTLCLFAHIGAKMLFRTYYIPTRLGRKRSEWHPLRVGSTPFNEGSYRCSWSKLWRSVWIRQMISIQDAVKVR